MNKKLKTLVLVFLVGVLLLGARSWAEDLNGKKILEKVDENRPESVTAIYQMTIVHKSGVKRIRDMKAWMKGDDYTLVKFISPADVKGTGLLSIKNDKWLYLPVLRKVRRIAAKEKKGSFMGSDFSYEDISTGTLTEDYKAKLLEEEYQERDCYVLELVPKDPKDISYSKLKRWVNKENFYSPKTEYYDEHGDLLKIMYLSDFEKIEGLWITKRMEMQNVQKGSKTIIVLKEVQLNPEISDDIFTTRYLERR